MTTGPSASGAGSHHSDGMGMLTVAVSGSPHSEWLVQQARSLAARLGVPWEALHVETPAADRDSPRGLRAAAALATAARLGATIARVPATSAADGIQAHLRTMPVRHLVLGHTAEGRRSWFRSPGIADRLLADEQRRAAGHFDTLPPLLAFGWRCSAKPGGGRSVAGPCRASHARSAVPFPSDRCRCATGAWPGPARRGDRRTIIAVAF